jgi:hypothetical protein
MANVRYTLEISPEDMPILGNASVGDNAEENEAYANEIIARLERGDDWAWCIVTVTAEYAGFKGTASMGGCSYHDEAEFTAPGGYYDDMRQEALADLRETLAYAERQGRLAAGILATL